ncbi:hypothetical protein G6M04_30250 [Agrobacterium rhizogenes]|uniref:hypothetical protein n=1 Tax=Rhizobium rhizogenes TaxID=359 RepID=UPI00157480A4|nr:hypothetical protein [Rhizobium rhizogenes]NTG51682.1 hypothetical protein [Rhizobium rhizogenes]
MFLLAVMIFGIASPIVSYAQAYPTREEFNTLDFHLRRWGHNSALTALLTLFAETVDYRFQIFVPNWDGSFVREEDRTVDGDGLSVLRKGMILLEPAPEGKAEVALLSDSTGTVRKLAIRLRGHGSGGGEILQQELGSRGTVITIRHPCYDEEAPNKYIDNEFLRIALKGESTLYAEAIYDEGLILVFRDEPTAEQRECRLRTAH